MVPNADIEKEAEAGPAAPAPPFYGPFIISRWWTTAMALPSRRLLRNVRLFWYAHHTLQRGNKAKAGSIVLVSSRTTTKRIKLSNYQPSTIAWIPSLKACLMFFGGSWGKGSDCYILLEVRREYFPAFASV